VPVLFIFCQGQNANFLKPSKQPLKFSKTASEKSALPNLMKTILKAIEAYHPPVVRGHPIKIKYITQLPTMVPSFAFFCNFPDDIKQPYKNYLENQLREQFNFSGVPVRLFFRKNRERFLEQSFAVVSINLKAER
jgi:GTP-binding protein